MYDNGRGGVAGIATMLPATTGIAYFLADATHPAIVWGFLAVSASSVLILIYYLVFFLLNRKRAL